VWRCGMDSKEDGKELSVEGSGVVRKIGVK
jgi:hypothetical protein